MLLILLASLLLYIVTAWNNNNVTETPPMGWASWNPFGCNYTEDTIKQQSKALVDLGLRKLGYDIVITQECIGVNRTTEGKMIVDPIRFPSGMRYLTDYIHALQLRAGIYTDVGPLTCAKYVGSYGYEFIDAKTFIVDWRFDFIEDDDCYWRETGKTIKQLYMRMHDAILATNVSDTIFYIACQGQYDVALWAQSVAHIQRTTHDIMSGGSQHASFATVLQHFWTNAQYAEGNGPQHWNDADMMVIGINGLSVTECITHFSMWCISAAPLWIGCDLTQIDEVILEILSNKEVIAVNQDKWGFGAIQLDGLHSAQNNTQVWWKVLKPLINEKIAVAVMLYNMVQNETQEMHFDFWEIGMNGNALVRDLWEHKNVGIMSSFTGNVEPHGVIMLRVSQ